MDSRFRGNDKLCYIVVIERLAISVGSKTVSLSYFFVQNSACLTCTRLNRVRLLLSGTFFDELCLLTRRF